MRLPYLISLALLGCCAVIMAADNVDLRVSTRKEVLKGVSAAIHAFSQVELLNLVSVAHVPLVVGLIRLATLEMGSKMPFKSPWSSSPIIPPFGRCLLHDVMVLQRLFRESISASNLAVLCL
jgi:hypothetical protein